MRPGTAAPKRGGNSSVLEVQHAVSEWENKDRGKPGTWAAESVEPAAGRGTSPAAEDTGSFSNWRLSEENIRLQRALLLRKRATARVTRGSNRERLPGAGTLPNRSARRRLGLFLLRGDTRALGTSAQSAAGVDKERHAGPLRKRLLGNAAMPGALRDGCAAACLLLLLLLLLLLRRRRRRARGLEEECGKSEGKCCLRSLKVSFQDIGWADWVVAPKSYYMRFCQGSCPHNYRAASMHAQVQARVHALARGAPAPCCVPAAYEPMVLMHYDAQGRLVSTVFEDMLVTKCHCA
ncbi:PREDICTED: growth/differentiation factor 15 [Tinamus guttatus]|uniref:growth/differentiation factor 15 n=1 Tax=Tinamus guttatus TaxID=94827 RepID=UPI00052EE140|nr:PREDICTED: growth/differentiation factor 15 [Tinamus guttatus]